MSLLPDDWTFVLPADESFAEPRAPEAPMAGVAPAAIGLLTVAGVPVRALTGEMELGSLNPVGKPLQLDASLGDLVGAADEHLSVEVMNRDYNPFAAQPVDSAGRPLIGPFTRGGETYQGKAFIPTRSLIQALADQMGDSGAALAPLIGALNEVTAFRTPAHQFNLPGGPSNNVLFYGGDTIGHGHIDRAVAELGARHMRMVKQMVHFDRGGQGGTPTDIVSDGVGGSTHTGGYSMGYRAGQKVSIKSDWPSGYGNLDHGSPTYNANLFAVDYQEGTEDTIPDEVLAQYKQNADMWDCCAGIVVPFTSEEPDPEHQDYQFNPLEVYDQASARAVAATLAELDRDAFLVEHGAFYCAEGQYAVANLGPQEDDDGGTLLKQSRYGDTPFGRLITTFQTAPGYHGMDAAQRRRHSEIGWHFLTELGEANGGISQEQFDALEETDRTAICLEWITEDCPGWQTYRPLNSEGLIARPMTVVTMAWGILRRYLPREAIARTIAMDILHAYQAGDDSVKQATILLCGGQDPASEAGQAALAGVAMKAATGMLLGMMNSDQFRDKILEKAGYNQITNDTDKQKVLAEYAKFVAVMQNADHGSQAALDAAMLESDASFGSLVVERRHYNAATGEYVPKRKTLMKYAAPSCIGMWAQQPYLAETACLRYVVTAMHTDQAAVALG